MIHRRRTWVPNLMILRRTCSFLWLIYIFGYFMDASTSKNWEHSTVVNCIFLQSAIMWLIQQLSRRKRLVFAKRLGTQGIGCLLCTFLEEKAGIIILAHLRMACRVWCKSERFHIYMVWSGISKPFCGLVDWTYTIKLVHLHVTLMRGTRFLFQN